MFAVGMLDGRDGLFIISNMRLCACVSACVRGSLKAVPVSTGSIHELNRQGSVTDN